jgi:hypothetical protein
MMEVVPENEQPPGFQPPAVRPPADPAPGQPHPPAPRAPLDPELVQQYQQFQQFQQFQEIMRQQGDVPLLPPAQKPLWQRILRRKLVRRLILLGILLITLPLWWNLLLAGVVSLAQLTFGSDNHDRPASESGGGTYRTNHILKDNPYDAVRQVYQRVADNSPELACGVFTDQAAQQFAEHFTAADCPAVVNLLHQRLDPDPSSPRIYAEPDFHGKMGVVPKEDSITISSCELGVTAGPRLGAFTLGRVERGQWIITGHQRESC